MKNVAGSIRNQSCLLQAVGAPFVPRLFCSCYPSSIGVLRANIQKLVPRLFPDYRFPSSCLIPIDTLAYAKTFSLKGNLSRLDQAVANSKQTFSLKLDDKLNELSSPMLKVLELAF